ncbi:MAG: hypothetical protein ACI4KG_02190, partial [Oscillospiraceae bacterium]
MAKKDRFVALPFHFWSIAQKNFATEPLYGDFAQNGIINVIIKTNFNPYYILFADKFQPQTAKFILIFNLKCVQKIKQKLAYMGFAQIF